VARELLAESGSIFVQIGDENVHRVRSLMDEVFGEDKYISIISLQKTAARSSEFIQNVADYVVWYAKNSKETKFHNLFNDRPLDDKVLGQYPFIYNEDGSYVANQNYSITPNNDNLARSVILTSSHEYSRGKEAILYQGKKYGSGSRYWSTSPEGIYRLARSNRIVSGGTSVSYLRRLSDYPYIELNNTWTDVATGGGSDRVYVVQTVPKVIQRCILMTTDPGDLVLDPTCGSGTTAYVAEQWGRRWITIDTSRVALALARSRIMGARYPYYLLADSAEGQMKEAELTQTLPSGKPTYNRVRHGFVYERVPHITLKSIANNTEIDVIWEKYQPELGAALAVLNTALKGFQSPFKIETGARAGTWLHFQNPDREAEYITLPGGEKASSLAFLEWEVPRNPPPDCKWPEKAIKALAAFWKIKIKRQKEIDASIAAKAEFEYLYDKPYEDRRKVRVAGPFTVDSISPHRTLGVDENGDIIDGQTKTFSEVSENEPPYGFTEIILENLKIAGVQQAHKDDKINFTSLSPWPGNFVCAEGFYREGDEETGTDRRAAIFIGPEFGTVTRPDLIEAAREAADAGFDLLIACAFNYEAHTTEFEKLGKIKILKARMNADLHMAGDLRNNGKGNLFVIFGEPDIDVEPAPDGQIRIRIKGVDVFHPNTGEIRSDGPEGIACWFIDTDYNEESFFVRHAYFLGANDPYGALKTSLKAEINADAWESLHSDISWPFDKPASGRIAIKVINHLGDEVMKVINVNK
jgi:adenine-specific DNA-methyltransferase